MYIAKCAKMNALGMNWQWVRAHLRTALGRCALTCARRLACARPHVRGARQVRAYICTALGRCAPLGGCALTCARRLAGARSHVHGARRVLDHMLTCARRSHVHGARVRGRRVGRLVSYEGGEAGQRRPRARHVVHDDLAAVEAHHGAALGLRVRVAGVVAHGPLPLPRLPQRVVHVRVVVHERVRLRAHALVLALRVLLTDTIPLYIPSV